MTFQVWTDAIIGSLNQVWNEVIGFIPDFGGALVVFVIGLVIASGLAHLVERGLVLSRIDSVFVKTGIPREFDRAGVRFSLSRFFGRLTYWFFLVVTVLSVANILLGGDSTVFSLLQPVLDYIPRIAGAVLILVGTVILANFLRHVVRASVLGAKLHSSKALGAVAWWAITIFGILAALGQLNIATEIINTLVMGVVAMFAIAGGIAFGLGGKEYATHLLAKFRNQVE